MPQALPHPTKLTQECSLNTRERVLTAQFGDGYSQEAPDGMYPYYDVWDLVYAPLTTSERNTAVAIFTLVGAWDYLTWTPFTSATEKKWKIVKDSRTESFNGSYHFLRLQVREFF